ncbi:MAG TPA: CAP domain-containing protein, partial [Candidatus Acidoferrum sp.]
MKNFAACLIAAALARVKNFAEYAASGQSHQKHFERREDSRFVSFASGTIVSCLSAVLFFFVSASAGAQSQIPPRNESERGLFELLNHERAANNLPEVKWDDALFKAARQHALLML